jgi:hypothetical protein
MSTLTQTIKQINKTFDNFTSRGGGIQMRKYQLEPAKAILDSIYNKRGLTIIVIISRQAGKDELLANLLSYLLNLYAHREVGIVSVNPTYKPQTINAIMRLENRLKANLITRTFWKGRSDFMRMIGSAVVSFLSGDKQANVVGAVASLLLLVNEAQDIDSATYDKKFAPMTASTNATKVIVGTEWTTDTLLAREHDNAKRLQEEDGIRRVFLYTADDVRKIIPAYGNFVDEQVRKLGRQHPLVKTQYFCERIDAITGMFTARRLALMQGDRSAQSKPEPGRIYSILIDVAGMDEAMIELAGMGNPGRDKTTLSIVDIDLSSLEITQAPTYRTVMRMDWQGQNHVDIFSAITAVMEQWNALYILVDATGVGEGLWAMLSKKFKTRVIGIKFTQQTKSEIGYGFLGIIEAGRFHDCAQTEEVREQYEKCTSEILTGPAKTMRWGVKDGTRGIDGRLVHDDYILADSLIAELDKLEWYVQSETTVIEQPDVLKEMDNAY